VAQAIKEKVFQAFGNPIKVRTDNGTEFKGEFDALCEACNVKHVRSAPYTSHSNGQVERLHRTIEELARKCLVTLPASAYSTVLRELQLTINTTYARSIGCAPYILMFGASPPNASNSALPDPSNTTTQRYV
jgi:transposase InsO family protein